MSKIAEIIQALIKVFVRSNNRFPQGTELKEIERQARQVLDGALTRNLDEAKGKNLDDIDVMEKTMDKNADQLIDDYLSNEATKGRMTSEPPTFTVVDERKLPRAEIEALPLKDKEKAEAAVRKKLEAQNVQTRQSKEGGESPGGPQRGRPELVDKNFGDTIYIDRRDMQILMGDAQDKFAQAEDAIRNGNYDEARGILRYEIEDNFKLPQATRDAAYDARVFLRRGEGLATDMGFDTPEETLQALKEKIDEGIQTTFPDNYPTFTNPEDASKMKNIEYVDFLDEAGEDFGTPNSIVSTPEDIDYEFKEGGSVVKRKGFLQGSEEDAADEDQGYSESDLDSANEATSGMGDEQSGGGGGYSQADLDRANARTTSQVGSFGSRLRNTARNVFNFLNKNRAASYLTSLAAGPFKYGTLAAPALAYASLYGPRPRRGITASEAGEGFIEEEQFNPFMFPQTADLSSFYTLRDQFRKDYMPNKYQSGGRVGFSIGGAGGIIRLINKLVKTKKMGAETAANLIDLMDQAKKAGIPIKTMKDLENFEKQIKETSGKLYESRKKYPGVEGEKSGLPVTLKGKAPKATSEEKLYDEYIYYRDELGNFKGSFDDFIIARRKAGSLYAEETPLSKETVKRKQNAEGGLNYLLGF